VADRRDIHRIPYGKIIAGIGAVTGLITILTFGGDAVDKVGDYIITHSELSEAENRIVNRIHKEAVITREAIVGEILVRKDLLHDQLEEAETEGEIARILEHIKDLNRRLDKIRGIDE